jgi:hypothetical protein
VLGYGLDDWGAGLIPYRGRDSSVFCGYFIFFFISFHHHNGKYGHTIRLSFLATCFSSLSHHQEFDFVIHLHFSGSIPKLASGILFLLVICNAVIYKKVCSALRLNINC